MNWIKATALPWIKENWHYLLIFPLVAPMLVLAGFALAMKRMMPAGPEVIDPTREADKRALEESKRREAELSIQAAELAAQLKELKDQTNRLRAENEARLSSQVQGLREHPQDLTAAMLQEGKNR